MRGTSVWRLRAVWLLCVAAGSIGVAAVLSGRVSKEADPKWELAIRSGMPFVSAELVSAPPALSPSDVIALRYQLDARFQRAFLEPQAGDYLVLAGRRAQTWLKSREFIDQWHAVDLVVSPTQRTAVRCYPRFVDMTSYDADFYAEGPVLEAGKWYRLRIFVRLFRQLTRMPLRDFRLDFVSARTGDLRVSDLSIEGEQ